MRTRLGICLMVAALGLWAAHPSPGADKSSGDPRADSYAPLPIIHYAAISIASSPAPNGVEWLSADDSLHVAFCWSNGIPMVPGTGLPAYYPMLQWQHGTLSPLSHVVACDDERKPDGTGDIFPISINGITNKGIAYGSTVFTPYDPNGGPDDHYPPPGGIPYNLNCFPVWPTFKPDAWNHLGWEDDNTHSGIDAGIYLANNTGGYAGYAHNIHNYAYSDGYAFWVGGTSHDAWLKKAQTSGDEPYAMFNYAFDLPGWAFFSRLKPPPPPFPAPGIPDLYFRAGALSDSGLALGTVSNIEASSDGQLPADNAGLGLWDGVNFRRYDSLIGYSVTDIDNEGHALLMTPPVVVGAFVEYTPVLLQTQAAAETVKTLNDLLAPAFQNEVKIVEAAMITNERASDHSYRILCYDQSLDPVKHPGGGRGILTNQPELDPQTHQPIKDHWTYARVALPDNVEVDNVQIHGLGINPDGILTTSGCVDTTKPQSARTSDVMLLLPVEIKATSVNSPKPPEPKTLNTTPYNKTPKSGSADSLLSVWPAIELTLTVEIPEPFKSSPPAGLITWTSAGFSVPDKTTECKFSWIDPGVKTVVIKVGGSTFKVVIDVPNVGNNSELEVLLAMNPVTALQVLAYGKEAEDYANRHFPDPATARRDAIRHSYWNALCASDSWIQLSAIQGFATAHEWDNKWGYKMTVNFNGQIDVKPQPAFDSTMDLFNNFVGRATVHFVSDGLGGHLPDRSAILSDLTSKYGSGVLYIWDGGSDEEHSQGILLKSDGKKIEDISP